MHDKHFGSHHLIILPPLPNFNKEIRVRGPHKFKFEGFLRGLSFLFVLREITQLSERDPPANDLRGILYG